ncbi:hypothetical protein, variant [Aphanomyces invadans]|uniref:Uncharacterized protein n=1 Tax=Aphanomyces invadans TaxID=157072 RepID=A0A024UT18_9STRA|nr:hypothetical protein, variant [Aphanomyces invadans]ETW08803.1 hypothetical protein, variant [Aphanomyces invadans]|eukprot:XP_008862608.1 hypothetical protein, variant [Aphanomyces invadans]
MVDMRTMVARFLESGVNACCDASSSRTSHLNHVVHDVDEAIVEYVLQLMDTQEVDPQQVVECIVSFFPDIDDTVAREAVYLIRESTQRTPEDSSASHPSQKDANPRPKPSSSSAEEMTHLNDLMELAPHLSLECIECILKDMFAGDIVRAAGYIVTHHCLNDLDPRQQLNAHIRQAISVKFADQEVKVPRSPSQKPVKVKVRAASSQQVRYLDSKVVTTTGKKFVEEKKEVYDGGSRGRVKTKGKRGRWI